MRRRLQHLRDQAGDAQLTTPPIADDAGDYLFSRNATEETGHHVADALTHQFAVGVVLRARGVVRDHGREEAVYGAEQRQDNGRAIQAALEDALGEKGGGLARLRLFEGISTWLRVGLLGGLILSSPVVIYQVWLFVAPGLYKRERRIAMPLGAVSTILFLGGAYFGYAVIFRFGFPYFLSIKSHDL